MYSPLSIDSSEVAKTTLSAGAHMFFPTSTHHTVSELNSRAAANSICTNAAQSANLKGSQYAVMSYADSDMRETFRPYGKIFNSRLEKVAGNMNDFYKGYFNNPINYDERLMS